MKETEILEFLRRNGLSVNEFHILSTIHYASHPPERLVPMAAWESEQWFGRLPLASEPECEEALGALFSKGLLQVIDGSAIAKIEAELVARPALGPLMGLPKPGEIDFTQEGGRLWQRIDSEVFDSGQWSWCAYGELNEDDGTFHSEYLGTTELAVRQAFASHLEGKNSEIILIKGPDPIGAWRDHWWGVVHQQGYRMVILDHPAPETK